MRSRRSWDIELLEGRELLSGVSYSLTTDQSNYQLGQQVNMTFTQTDTGDQPVTVEVGALNVDVDWGSGGILWQADSGTPPTSETLQPGQSLSQTVTWDGGDTEPNGSPFYVYGPIQASIVDQPSGISLASASFQIASPIQETLTTSGSATVWESDPGAASQPTTSETLPPGQFLTETATWRGLANEGPMAGTDLFANTSNSNFTVSVLGAPSNGSFGFQNSQNPLYDAVWATGPGGAPASTAGQPINFTATETNTSDLPVTILNAGDAFDILLGYDEDLLIPASNVSPVGQVVTLQPGQSQTFTTTWDPDSDPNLPLGSQTYSVFFDDNSEGFGEPYLLTIDIPASSGAHPSATGSTAPTSGAPPGSPLAATVSARQNATQPGGPVRITLTLQNASHDKVRLAPFSGRAEITLLRGSTVVATARKRLSVAHVQTLMPGRGLRLTTDLEIKPSRADVRTLGPGTYTVEVEDGGYAAETAIQVGGF